MLKTLPQKVNRRKNGGGGGEGDSRFFFRDNLHNSNAEKL